MRAVAPDELATSVAVPSPDHAAGCPALRIEQYTAVRPSDHQVLAMTRCIDCGAQRGDPTGTFMSTNVEGVQ